MFRMTSGSIKHGLIPTALLGVMMTTGTVLQAGTIINENFQSQTINTNPVALLSSGTDTPTGNVTTREDEPNGRIVNVVDAVTTPADPFGGAGNQSLRLYSTITTSAASVFFRSSSTGLNSGFLTLDFDVTTTQTLPDPGPWLSVILGGTTSGTSLGGTSTDSIVRIDFRSNGEIALRRNGGISTADQTFTSGTAYTLRIDFDTTTDLFSVKLNNTAITSGAGAVSSWTALSTSLASVNAVHMFSFAAGSTTIKTGQAFVDNIVLSDVPEPAGMALLALGGLMLLHRRDR